ncbi:MAG: S-layer homology domain-containing protein [Clostridia bacterium]|nr:S-layer homology domain-containing protein [Clostridia bacterium]
MFSEKNNTKHKNKVENFTKLYTESISAENLYLKNSEWGICKYSTEISGEVCAFYFYSSYDDEYLISEIKDKIPVTPKGDISTNFQNRIDFGTGRALQGGYEVFDYDFAYPFTLRIGINTDKDIIYRGIFYNNSGRNCVINKYEYLSGNLDSLEFDLQEAKPVESASPEDDEQKEDETEKKDEQQEKQEDNKETEQEKNEDKKTETDKALKEETAAESEKENKTESTENNNESLLDYDFIDVPKNHWAYNNIYEFAEKGIVLGYGNGYFGVNDPITYEHFGLLLDRLFNYKADNNERVPSIREDVIVSVVKALNIDVSDTKTAIIDQKFSDCKNLKTDSLKYVAAAIECGLVIGADGELFPDEQLTRAETVTLLKRAVEYNAE